VRWALNRLALAITSMVALAFLVPLAVATRQIAHDRAISEARQQATALVTVLGVDADPTLLTNAVASTTAGGEGRLAVHLPAVAPIGATHLPAVAPIGATHLTDVQVAAAARDRRPVLATVAGGVAYLQPTVLTDGRTVIVEVLSPPANCAGVCGRPGWRSVGWRSCWSRARR
jgi:hypothetical protein